MVFDRDWFLKHQRVLLKIANSCIGELVFGFKKMGHEKGIGISRILPNSIATARKKGKKIEVTEQFFSRNEYSLKLYYKLFPIWWACHLWDIITRPIPQLNLGFDTLTVYPDAGSGNTTVDGESGIHGNQYTWAQLRDGNTGNITSATETTSHIGSLFSGNDPNWFGLWRGFFTFSTNIGSSAVVSSAVLSVYGNSYVADFGTPELHVTSSTQTNNNSLSNSDYSAIGRTSFGSILGSSFSTAGYNDITLNTSGKSNIAKTGISKFSTQLGWDLNNSQPTHPGNAKSVYFYVYMADNGSNKPKLVITYTLPNHAPDFFLFF